MITQLIARPNFLTVTLPADTWQTDKEIGKDKDGKVYIGKKFCN